jgi:hypothetical protein
MYAVIHFVGGSQVEVVPKVWLHSGRKKVWWPPMKGKRFWAAAEDKEPPTPSWECFDVKVIIERGWFYRNIASFFIPHYHSQL